MTSVGYSGVVYYKDRVLANPSVTVGDTFPCRDGFKWFGFYLLEKVKVPTTTSVRHCEEYSDVAISKGKVE